MRLGPDPIRARADHAAWSQSLDLPGGVVLDLPGNDDQSHWTDKIGMSILQLFFQIK